MNFLAHVKLCHECDEHIIGSIVADFVRGRLDRFPNDVARAIQLHRKVDSFTDQHPIMRELRNLFPTRYRRTAGITLDLLCDHVLVNSWSKFDQGDLNVFCDNAYRGIRQQASLLNQQGLLDTAVNQWLQRRCQGGWWQSYHRIDTMHEICDRLARRLKRPELLLGATRIWPHIAEPLETHFPEFWRDLEGFVKAQKSYWDLS